MITSTQRRAAAIGMAAAAALVLAACSSDTTDAEATESASPAETATEAAAFPVTLDTVMGEVTIDSEPQRVVTLGSHEHEYLYALGVAPVAVPESWQDYELGTGPWAVADMEAAGANPETFVPGSGTYDAELIASFEPDLIVATYPNHTMTQEEYDLLSGIAPVVTRPATGSDGVETVEWGVSLADELTLLAAATGTSDTAVEILADIDAEFAAVREAHPEWEGLTSQVGGFYEGQAFVYAATDTRNQFLASVGLDVTAVEGTDAAWLQISAEQLDTVLGDLDSVVWQVATTPEAKDSLEALPLFASLNSTTTGGNVWLTDTVLEGAFFANSPSSIAYTIEHMVPLLEAALDGDPATEAAA
ncbi:ABC transporter substrate-binding protein [Demequina lignilytica]|uniref:ABC transporter substrate-binding protein n=1 Tax=Demequina lignilytica TaxID=3051663 RepID=A0AB35MIW0_9MICO|nr:ABC transporter substrate-binding protein [Demequina sp. SYSU T0a273]MDN4483667.1 ABC transporter substrate-binding protein [Demequina sp. SYSU T0a273]